MKRQALGGVIAALIVLFVAMPAFGGGNHNYCTQGNRHCETTTTSTSSTTTMVEETTTTTEETTTTVPEETTTTSGETTTTAALLASFTAEAHCDDEIGSITVLTMDHVTQVDIFLVDLQFGEIPLDNPWFAPGTKEATVGDSGSTFRLVGTPEQGYTLDPDTVEVFVPFCGETTTTDPSTTTTDPGSTLPFTGSETNRPMGAAIVAVSLGLLAVVASTAFRTEEEN